jgi:hypothetical protein
MLLFARPQGHARRRAQGIIGVRLGSPFPSRLYESARVLTSSIVLALVLVIDSLDRLARAIPTDASFSCSRCFRLS